MQGLKPQQQFSLPTALEPKPQQQFKVPTAQHQQDPSTQLLSAPLTPASSLVGGSNILCSQTPMIPCSNLNVNNGQASESMHFQILLVDFSTI